jgi:hypothetical protein
VRVTVTPSTLRFTSPWEKDMYALRVSSTGNSPLVDGRVYQGSVTLISTSHTVRTPLIAVVGLPNPLVLHRTQIGLASPDPCR